jgi:hypothetical protein
MMPANNTRPATVFEWPEPAGCRPGIVMLLSAGTTVREWASNTTPEASRLALDSRAWCSTASIAWWPAHNANNTLLGEGEAVHVC